MKATSFRLPDETLSLLNRLRLPGESQAAVIHRALVALDGQPPPLSVEALAQRIDLLEGRLLALESCSASVVQPTETGQADLTEPEHPANLPEVETTDPAPFTLAPSEPGEGDIKAALTHRICQMRDQGMTSAEIAAALNAEGVPTFSGRGKWQPGTVRAILAAARKN